jgi:hypothetical protein
MAARTLQTMIYTDEIRVHLATFVVTSISDARLSVTISFVFLFFELARLEAVDAFDKSSPVTAPHMEIRHRKSTVMIDDSH